MSLLAEFSASSTPRAKSLQKSQAKAGPEQKSLQNSPELKTLEKVSKKSRSKNSQKTLARKQTLKKVSAETLKKVSREDKLSKKVSAKGPGRVLGDFFHDETLVETLFSVRVSRMTF